MNTRTITERVTKRAFTFFLLLAAISLNLAGLPLTSALTVASAQEQDRTESIQAGNPLMISEFRLRGPSGANDEFVEIYNNSDSPHTVAGGGAGYAVAASTGVLRFTIPNGTVIPAR